MSQKELPSDPEGATFVPSYNPWIPGLPPDELLDLASEFEHEAHSGTLTNPDAAKTYSKYLLGLALAKSSYS